jgi:PAS domain S-box-containing protein
MNPPDEKKPHDPQLRAAAETQLAKTAMAATTARPVEDLLHDLQVHQIELEMQNEALRQANIALEDSRDRYVDLYEFAPVGYLTLTSDGLIAEINLTGTRLLGLERKNLLHKRFTSFVIPEDQDRWTRHYLSVKSDGGQGSAELALQRGDGTAFHAQLDCIGQKSGAGNATIRIVLSDNTARKQADEALLKAGALQSAIFNSANFSSIATDAKGVIQIFNVGAERMLGYTAAEVMNKITPADISDPQEVIARA